MKCDPGEGDSQRVHLSPCLWTSPLTPTLSPQERGEGAHERRIALTCAPTSSYGRGEGETHDQSKNLHHLRDNRQHHQARAIAVSADHAAADRRQRAGGG